MVIVYRLLKPNTTLYGQLSTMKTLSSKEIIAIWFAIIAACISITALWMPPQGIIDETVLILIGQLLLFIATLVGVDGALMRLAQVMRNRAEKPPEEAI